MEKIDQATIAPHAIAPLCPAQFAIAPLNLLWQETHAQ